jgi:excisionase family DNA binding protein
MLNLEEKSVLTTHEVAKYLNVYTNTVIHWMNAGKLNGYRTPGGHRRILREELFRFIKNNHMEDCVRQSQLKKILIVEDDEDAMDLYISILEKDNYEIKKSYTGFSSGVAIDFKPDLVILDIMLPDLDGFRICDFIRKSPEIAHTKILVISAISELKKIRKMYDLGADDYLVKPFSIIELKNKIKKHLFPLKEEIKEVMLVK